MDMPQWPAAGACPRSHAVKVTSRQRRQEHKIHTEQKPKKTAHTQRDCVMKPSSLSAFQSWSWSEYFSRVVLFAHVNSLRYSCLPIMVVRLIAYRLGSSITLTRCSDYVQSTICEYALYAKCDDTELRKQWKVSEWRRTWAHRMKTLVKVILCSFRAAQEEFYNVWQKY